MTHKDDHENQPGPPDDRFVEVSISTTAGFFPAEGYDRVPLHQKIRVQLEKARDALKIKDVAGWIATVDSEAGKRNIDPERSYLDNGLHGQVEIDWGPAEGGGGVTA